MPLNACRVGISHTFQDIQCVPKGGFPQIACKTIIFHSTAGQKIPKSTTTLADGVHVSRGATSKPALTERKRGAPILCNDRVTMKGELRLRDPEVDLGAQVHRNATERHGGAVGDSSGTMTTLAPAIFADGARNLVAGSSAKYVKRGLDPELHALPGPLIAQSMPLVFAKKKEQVATTTTSHCLPRMTNRRPANEV